MHYRRLKQKYTFKTPSLKKGMHNFSFLPNVPKCVCMKERINNFAPTAAVYFRQMVVDSIQYM